MVEQIVTKGDLEDPEIIPSAHRKGRLFTSPFEKEREAIWPTGMALERIIQERTAEVTNFSDNQALLRAIRCGSSSVASIISQLNINIALQR